MSVKITVGNNFTRLKNNLASGFIDNDEFRLFNSIYQDRIIRLGVKYADETLGKKMEIYYAERARVKALEDEISGDAEARRERIVKMRENMAAKFRSESLGFQQLPKKNDLDAYGNIPYKPTSELIISGLSKR